MSEEDAFLEGIASDRADRTRLLVFADWLAEQGDPREEFVRLQAQLLEMDGSEPGFAGLENDWQQWTGGVAVFSGAAPDKTRDAPIDDRWCDSLCRVFTAAEVRARWARTPDVRPAEVARQVFSPLERVIVGGTETLVLYQARADRFGGVLDFVARTVLTDLWDDPFRAAVPATEPFGSRFLAPVTRGGFWNQWRMHRAGLRNPPPMPVIAPDDHFLGGQYLEGDWNNWAYVAAYQHSYFALLWSTTG
jgi:uncharacterized protein (TIGR02996 family)